MEYNTFIKECSGKDKNGEPKCGILYQNEVWHVDLPSNSCRQEILQDFHTVSAVVNIFRTNETVNIDLDFERLDNIDLHRIWALLQEWGNAANSYSEDQDHWPECIVNIMPLKYQGKFGMYARSPIFWTLTSARVGGDNTVIRLIYKAEDVRVFETDENQVDYAAIEAELELVNSETEELAERMEMEKNKEEYNYGKHTDTEKTPKNNKLDNDDSDFKFGEDEEIEYESADDWD